ncbi:sugar ABC transporter ATP-binding protein [Amycolatopsis pithecellobii]|uniref:ATP-binding cassette domain-containing protein n=1 Tax=Amycolatopsis pithecellobii TaxID=664692 RepID=A0A6N7YJ55_9PSEU|nr:sugar ABC transporter ATP-binding protein [Amycolatopsis pithecellobii]MTD52907.1 ATP-binding cassette domain-containing protein [Amycolatopsis pithecellobii]
MPENAALEVRGLTKSFPGVQALKGVDLSVARGEIHALAGGNGSGKSTLIKIITGVQHGDDGTIQYATGSPLAAAHTSPELAHAGGVYVVHQDFGLFPAMTVAENFALGFGFPTGPAGRVRWRTVRKRAAALIDKFEISTTPSSLVRDTPRAVQAQIAIARALQAEDEQGGQGLLILDEPTAALPSHEVELLFASLRRHVAAGQAVLFVSHRLDEILDLADNVTVFRDGTGVGTYRTPTLSEAALAELIAGRPISQTAGERVDRRANPVLLELSDVVATPLHSINLTVRSGEVVGVAGLLGSGRSELLRCIYGDLPIESGTVVLDGAPVRFRHPRDAIDGGIALVPESRANSVFYDLPVSMNLAVARLPQYSRRMWLSERLMRLRARQDIATFGVKAASERRPANVLSGGNQQKVVLGRCLGLNPKLLLLDEPTQGVDVGARREIYDMVRKATDAGMGVVLVASDMEELAHNCDRAIVLSGGRIVDELAGSRLTAHALVAAAYSGASPRKAG